MTISEYIKSKEELSSVGYELAYQTIQTLIKDGLLSREDFD